MKELMKYFLVTQMVAIISQLKLAPRYVYDKYFGKNKEPKLSPSIQIPIYKGEGVVLESVSEEGEHLIQDAGKKFLIDLTIPRFPLEKTISASELNQIASLKDTKQKVESLSQRISQILKEHKNSFLTTLEFMATGALFGKVVDGKGKTLFEFKSQATPIEAKSGVALITVLNEIDEALEKELGFIPPYDILASRSYVDGIAKIAQDEELFKNNLAQWKEDEGRRVLIVYGIKFIPYSATYKNTKGQSKKFLEDNTAIVTPLTEEVYKTYYSRANHTEALKLSPKMFFSATPEPLGKGKGYSVISEMRAIPICVRPGALIPLKYTN
jgi:hypothetical protein